MKIKKLLLWMTILLGGVEAYSGTPTYYEGPFGFELNKDSKEAWIIFSEDLEELDIPSEIIVDNVKYTVTSLLEDALRGKNLKILKVPSSINYFGLNSCTGSFTLEELYIDNIEYWCNTYFSHAIVDQHNGGAEWTEYNYFDSNPISNQTVFYIEGNPIEGDFTVPEGVTKINGCAFRHLNYKKVKLPDSLKEIKNWAFWESDIEEIDLGNNVKTIGRVAFQSCHNLKNIIFPESLKYIESDALNYCSSLETVTYPATITRCNLSYDGCSNLKSIYLPSVTTPGKQSGGITPPTDENTTFYVPLDKDVAENCTLYVPEESVELYKADRYWGQFKNIVGMNFDGPAGITDLQTPSDINDGLIYNLNGQRVNPDNIKPGFYIRNGKKFVVR